MTDGFGAQQGFSSSVDLLWVKTINIAGRQYLTQEAIDEFRRRASAREFSKAVKIPSRKEAGVAA